MKQILVLINTIIIINIYAQTGGTNTFEFLNLPNAARVASLGGNSIAIYDNDLNLVFHNPALLTKQMNNNLVLNYINYFSDINFGYISYARSFEKYGTFATGLHYINYGKFIRADETGIIQGNFTAQEYALNIMHARDFNDNISYGVNMKLLYSALDSYFSSGIAFDAGVIYHSDKQLDVAFVIKNAGIQLKRYYKGNREPLPFDIQLGLSKKLQYAPFRLCVVAENLTNFSMRYDKPQESTDIIFTTDSNQVSFAEKWADEFMRHLIFGVEFTPSDNFYIRLGYNYQRRQELKITTKTGIVGFSGGFGIRIAKFDFSYGLARYHLAGTSHHFSVNFNLSDFIKKE
ncbi:MAG: type IX secretion system protein PorQ [Marinilabiliales bacterium]